MFSGKKIRELEDQILILQTELNNTTISLQATQEQLQITSTTLTSAGQELKVCSEERNQLMEKFKPVTDIEMTLAAKKKEINDLQQATTELNSRYQEALNIHSALLEENNLYVEKLDIGSFGLYAPQFNYDTSDKFKLAIEVNYEAQKQMIKEGKAVHCPTEWTVGGSKTEGKKMTDRYQKLMLLAFNGECDGLVAKVKWNNAEKSKDRIVKSFQNINKLGKSHNIEITIDYCGLKLTELSLTYEYEQKKYDEKEEQRLIREQMREEEKAQREFERAQREAEDEEYRYKKALEKAQEELKAQENNAQLQERVKLLEQQIEEAHEKKERAIAMAQLTKVGHIYVISNIGSFGENVYKVGMTRRLDPLDRVRELGDASVPFTFDVHAIIYSEDAPQLEYDLHKKFSDRRINRINNKKEFFRITLDEIESFVHEHVGAAIEFTKLAEAKDYRETLTLLEQLKAAVESKAVEDKFTASLRLSS
jgi:hypothetical protein